VRSLDDTKEGDVCATEEALLSRSVFLKLCGGGLVGLAGLLSLGVAGCGGENKQDNPESSQENKQQEGQREEQQNVQQKDQQEIQQNVDRCPLRC
jgi:hypothetical protein